MFRCTCKILSLLFLFFAINSCSVYEESWNDLLDRSSASAAFSLSYTQKVETYNSFPGYTANSLPPQLTTLTVPIRREENFQMSIHKDGSLEIFTEIIPVIQEGFSSSDRPSDDLPEEFRFIHMVGGMVNTYDKDRNLLSSYPMNLGDHSDVLEQIRVNKERLPATVNSMIAGNPFLLTMGSGPDGPSNPTGAAAGSTAPNSDYYTMESEYLDEVTNSIHRQIALVHKVDQTVEQFRTYNSENRVISVTRLVYDKNGDAPQLVFTEDTSVELLKDGTEMIVHANTEYENFKITLNLN